jgi:hypothetical protein
VGRALSVRCAPGACELGWGETGFAERFSDGRFELIRPLLDGRFALGDRFDALLLDVLLLDVVVRLGDVAGW